MNECPGFSPLPPLKVVSLYQNFTKTKRLPLFQSHGILQMICLKYLKLKEESVQRMKQRMIQVDTSILSPIRMALYYFPFFFMKLTFKLLIVRLHLGKF